MLGDIRGMRTALAFAALALVLASSSAAQERGRYQVVTPTPVALRGSQTVDGPARPLAPIAPQTPDEPYLGEPIGGAASVKWTVKPQRGAAGQCRTACDRTYYSCLSAEDADACSPTWGQCRSKCETPKG
ncbi:MAG TPA: hypothetical protein VIO94_12250 [Phenylobacterium sp.]